MLIEECKKIYDDGQRVYDGLSSDEKNMPHGINLANKLAELLKQMRT